MYIQDKVSWNGEVENRLRLMKTLGVDCVAMDIPDGPRDGGAIDLSSVESATAFFRKAKSTVAAHGMELRTVLATNGFEEVKRGLSGRDRQIAWLLNAVQGMGVADRVHMGRPAVAGQGKTCSQPCPTRSDTAPKCLSYSARKSFSASDFRNCCSTSSLANS